MMVSERTNLRRRRPCRDSGGDPRSLELAARMEQRGRALSTLQRELLADIAEFDRGGGWRGDGAVSMVAWLTERLGVSGGTARLWARVAAGLESLPHLAGALGDGLVSLDVIAPLASDVATAANDAE